MRLFAFIIFVSVMLLATCSAPEIRPAPVQIDAPNLPTHTELPSTPTEADTPSIIIAATFD